MGEGQSVGEVNLIIVFEMKYEILKRLFCIIIEEC